MATYSAFSLLFSLFVTDLAAGSQLTIVEEPQSVTLAPGAVTELRCEVFGTPVPTIQWLHNGQVMRMGEKPYSFVLPVETGSPVMAERLSNRGMRTFQMATTSSKISIPCADSSRAGLYTCFASNGQDTVTANATVRVVEKGEVAYFVIALFALHTYLMFQAMLCGNQFAVHESALVGGVCDPRFALSKVPFPCML